jgi:sortase A
MPRFRPTRLPQPRLAAVGTGLVLLAVFLLGFAVYLYGLSGVQEARAQSGLYEQIQLELANEVAPLGATAPGRPVAILTIPAIGVHDMVVVQGTSPENLTLGPGHLADTPLPGQAGVSEIYGRRATFGGPFSRLDQLRAGDAITIITGQGKSVYQVAAVGSSQTEIQDPESNRLVLLTASSAAVPTYYTDVDARLTSTAQPSDPAAAVISGSELPLAGDAGSLGLTLLWGMALVAVSAAGTVAATRWSPWLAWLAAAPLALAVLWNLYQNLSALLPNVY